MGYNFTFTEDITLVVLDEAPADLCFVASAFEALSVGKINIDMISNLRQKVHHRVSPLPSQTAISERLSRQLQSFAKFSRKSKFRSAAGNTKLLISGDDMKNNYGIAAEVFNAVAATHADVRMITTSETDISLLITNPDVELIKSKLSMALNA